MVDISRTSDIGSSIDVVIEDLTAALSHGRESCEDLIHIENVAFSGSLTRIEKTEWLLKGTLTATLAAACYRCLADARSDVSITVRELFLLADVPAGESFESSSGEDVYAYSGNAISIEQALRDNLWTQAPQRLLCREDCAGVCPVCGIDRNTKTCDCTEEKALSPFSALSKLELDL